MEAEVEVVIVTEVGAFRDASHSIYIYVLHMYHRVNTLTHARSGNNLSTKLHY